MSEGSNYEIGVHCLDSKGAVKWSKRLGTPKSELITSMTLSHDGLIAIAGRAPFDSTYYGLLFLKLDQDGTVLISNVYYFERISSMNMKLAATPDKGFILTGRGNPAP